VREAIPALERARAEDPLAPAFAGFLSNADLADGNLAGALAEVDRGLKLEGLKTSLRGTGLVVALTRRDRVEIDKRLSAIPDSDPSAGLHRRLAQFMDAPAGAAAEIRHLASMEGRSKTMLVLWAAYYGEPELSLELLVDVAPHLNHPAVLWQPLLRDVRKLPGFKDLVRNLGFVAYWHVYGWPDVCHPLGDEDFVCG
jgi:hypothetical protein